MNSKAITRSSFSTRYLVLPVIYVAAVFVTAGVSLRMPGGAYYRIGGICPPVASLGMIINSDITLITAFLLLGIPWWYLIGRIGWSGLEHRRTVLSPILGSAVAFLTCFISTAMTADTLKQDARDGLLRSGDIAQYFLVAVLCIGALLSAVFAAINAFTPSRQT